jgi:hypothetical protein
MNHYFIFVVPIWESEESSRWSNGLRPGRAVRIELERVGLFGYHGQKIITVLSLPGHKPLPFGQWPDTTGLAIPVQIIDKFRVIYFFSICLLFLSYYITTDTHNRTIIINITIDRVGFKRHWKPLYRSELHLNRVPAEYKEITLLLSRISFSPRPVRFHQIWSRCSVYYTQTHLHHRVVLPHILMVQSKVTLAITDLSQVVDEMSG